MSLLNFKIIIIIIIGDCEPLSLFNGVYRIINQNNSAERLTQQFQCVHTPYQIDPVFTTQCLAGQWNPHPRDVCDQDFTITVYHTGYG